MGTINPSHTVNFETPRSFSSTLKSNCKELFFPDDPFRQFRNEPTTFTRTKKAAKYFIPILDWLPNYNLRLFRYDLLAGITITTLAIPQGISYAKLANLPPIIGLYCSFIPPLIYAIFGSSKHVAIGNVAACSLLISEMIGPEAVNDPALYLNLAFTSTFFTGVFETLIGLLRLGFMVDFLSHSTITGFMAGTATLICLQQIKGLLGLIHFTHKTDAVSVLRAVFDHRSEWKWESFTIGVLFLIFLESTRFLKKRKPKLFWVSAIAPMVLIVIGCLFAYFAHAEKHGIQIVGHLRKGLSPLSIDNLNFNSKYLPVTIKTGLLTALVSLSEGIAIGRSFAIMNNEQVDGNKEITAFGLMNIVGSFFSCYLTTGPFSKTAVNYNAGCKTQMSNIVMSLCMMLTLLCLAPVFSYTPLVALSAIIMSAMFGLIKYDEIYRLFKVDKFDFLICISCLFGVAFIGMVYGLAVSIGLALLRTILYAARPTSCRLGKIPNSTLYRDTEQYPGLTRFPGILALQLGSPIFFANSNYIRERILRWIQDEEDLSDNNKADVVQHVILELSALSVMEALSWLMWLSAYHDQYISSIVEDCVTSIDSTGIETLLEIHQMLGAKNIKMGIVNPRRGVMEKMMKAHFVDKIGKENIYLCMDDAVDQASTFLLGIEKHLPSSS